MSKCKAHTKSGKSCKSSAIKGSEYCHIKAHQQQDPEAGLTDKQKRFVEEYCIDYNATRSAISAGYSKKTASEQGYQLLQKTSVQDAIKKRMDELSMSAEEAVKRLADMGRGSFESFMEVQQDGTLKIDLSNPEARKQFHLIKKIKQKDVVRKSHSGDDEVVTDRVFEIELHDSKDAIDKILKVWGKYAPEKLDVNMKTAEWDPEKGDPRDYVQGKITGG